MFYRAHKVYETALAVQLELTIKNNPDRTVKHWVPKSLIKAYKAYSNVEMYEVADWFAKKELSIFAQVDKYNRAV